MRVFLWSVFGAFCLSAILVAAYWMFGVIDHGGPLWVLALPFFETPIGM